MSGQLCRAAVKLRFSFNLPETSAAYNIFNVGNFRLGVFVINFIVSGEAKRSVVRYLGHRRLPFNIISALRHKLGSIFYTKKIFSLNLKNYFAPTASEGEVEIAFSPNKLRSVKRERTPQY